MPATTSVTLSHIGICTSDVERSTRFYTEALGFTLERSIDDIGTPYDTLMELPGTTCCARYLKCGGVTIELVGYPDANVVGLAERGPMNRLGFTHMTLVVDDVDAVAERIVSHGGQVHAGTKIMSPYGPAVMCTDPDGVRVELIASVS